MILNNIETHLHYGGSISVSFVWSIIQKQGLKHLASNIEDVHDLMTFQPGEKYDFYRFLNKFTILNELKWDENTIDLSVYDVCHRLAIEDIDYAWIDISINKYMDIGWHKHEAIKFIYDSFQK